MEKNSYGSVLSLLEDFSKNPGDDSLFPPFDDVQEHQNFWCRLNQLKEEGYVSNVILTQDNKGSIKGCTFLSPIVLTTKGEQYLFALRQKEWWRRGSYWLLAFLGSILIYVINLLCGRWIERCFFND